MQRNPGPDAVRLRNGFHASMTSSLAVCPQERPWAQHRIYMEPLLGAKSPPKSEHRDIPLARRDLVTIADGVHRRFTRSQIVPQGCCKDLAASFAGRQPRRAAPQTEVVGKDTPLANLDTGNRLEPLFIASSHPSSCAGRLREGAVEKHVKTAVPSKSPANGVRFLSWKGSMAGRRRAEMAAGTRTNSYLIRFAKAEARPFVNPVALIVELVQLDPPFRREVHRRDNRSPFRAATKFFFVRSRWVKPQPLRFGSVLLIVVYKSVGHILSHALVCVRCVH
jgi:hypothetical protein